jgi:hypothetical protein
VPSSTNSYRLPTLGDRREFEGERATADDFKIVESAMFSCGYARQLHDCVALSTIKVGDSRRIRASTPTRHCPMSPMA